MRTNYFFGTQLRARDAIRVAAAVQSRDENAERTAQRGGWREVRKFPRVWEVRIPCAVYAAIANALATSPHHAQGQLECHSDRQLGNQWRGVAVPHGISNIRYLSSRFRLAAGRFGKVLPALPTCHRRY